MTTCWWPSGQWYPFWREESGFPFVHYVLFLSAYVTSRNLLLTVVLVYAWESLEQVLARAGWAHRAGEQWDDSWWGDVLIGVLGAASFALIDEQTAWSATATAVPLGVRLAVYAAHIVTSWCIVWPWPDQTHVRPGVLVVTVLYAAASLLGYAWYFTSVPGVSGTIALQLALVAASALLAAPVVRDPTWNEALVPRPGPLTASVPLRGPPGVSAWQRQWYLGVVVLLVALAWTAVAMLS